MNRQEREELLKRSFYDWDNEKIFLEICKNVKETGIMKRLKIIIWDEL